MTLTAEQCADEIMGRIRADMNQAAAPEIRGQ